MSSEVLPIPMASHSWLFYVSDSDDAGLHIPLLQSLDVCTQLFIEIVDV